MDNNQLEESIFDENGYRFNVAIIIVNEHGQVFWGKRRGQNSWQFPQGGMNAGESAEQAMLRELYEETGLKNDTVDIIGVTQEWLKYRLPIRYRRRRRPGTVQCIGQRQKWYLLKLRGSDSVIDLNASNSPPEFDDWRWVDYWLPLKQVVNFKRTVYKQALEELAIFVPNLPSKDHGQFDQNINHQHHQSKRRKAPSFAKKSRQRDLNS